MADMNNAKMVSARLELWVPYPQELREALAKLDSDIRSALATLPAEIVPVLGNRLYREFCPAISKFDDEIDMAPIRVEFTRKAKKIGLEVKDGAVNWQHENGGVLLWCTATGRV